MLYQGLNCNAHTCTVAIDKCKFTHPLLEKLLLLLLYTLLLHMITSYCLKPSHLSRTVPTKDSTNGHHILPDDIIKLLFSAIFSMWHCGCPWEGLLGY